MTILKWILDSCYVHSCCLLVLNWYLFRHIVSLPVQTVRVRFVKVSSTQQEGACVLNILFRYGFLWTLKVCSWLVSCIIKLVRMGGGGGARIPAPPVARRGSKQRGGGQVAVAYPGSDCLKCIAVALRISGEGSALLRSFMKSCVWNISLSWPSVYWNMWMFRPHNTMIPYDAESFSGLLCCFIVP